MSADPLISQATVGDDEAREIERRVLARDISREAFVSMDERAEPFASAHEERLDWHGASSRPVNRDHS